MNEVLEQFKQMLITKWNENDTEIHNQYLKFHEEHRNERFDWGSRRVSDSEYFSLSHDLSRHEVQAMYYGLDNQVRKENEKAAQRFVENLEKRIEKITGEIQSISYYTTDRGTGWMVRGENGNAEVLTIEAGGYNIQRLHVRNLVKKVK